MSIYWISLLLLLVVVCWRFLFGSVTPPVPPTVGGYVHPAFYEVKEVFRKNVESGSEPGASFAVYKGGEVLVDLWGGWADPGARRPWQEDTLSQAWSSTKGVAAVVMATLVDRGLLDYNEYVHTYWPEFGQNGKSNVTVGMLLSHQAGLVSLGRQVSLAEYRDKWSEMERLMAGQIPAWPPGTRYCYHAFTYGMYADALVRRVDTKHRNITTFFKEEIAQPLDLDFYIGLPMDLYYRSTRASYVTTYDVLFNVFISRPARWKWLPEIFFGNILHNSLTVFDFINDFEVMNAPEPRSVGLSSCNGFGTARSLAKLYDYLANGGTIKGKQLLSARQVMSLSTPVTSHIPVIAAPEDPYAMGMMVWQNILGEPEPVFGHRGYGGQNGYADPNHGVGVAYITNFNSGYSDTDDPRALDLLQVLYKCLTRYNRGDKI